MHPPRRLELRINAHIITLRLFTAHLRHQQLSARVPSAVLVSLCCTAATGSTTMDGIHESTSNEKVEAQISTSQHIETQVPPLSASRNKPLSDDEETKVQKIINATETRNWHALGRLAASPGGFIDDEVRRIVCTC